MHMLVLEFPFIAYRINLVFSILRRLDTLASTMTSTKCTFSYIHVWTCGRIENHPERRINKKRSPSPSQLRFCHWEVVKYLSDLPQHANDHSIRGGYTAAQQVTVIWKCWLGSRSQHQRGKNGTKLCSGLACGVLCSITEGSRGPWNTPLFCTASQKHSLIQLNDKHMISEFTYFFFYHVKICIGVSCIINHTQINKDDMLVLLEIPGVCDRGPSVNLGIIRSIGKVFMLVLVRVLKLKGTLKLSWIYEYVIYKSEYIHLKKQMLFEKKKKEKRNTSWCQEYVAPGGASLAGQR